MHLKPNIGIWQLKTSKKHLSFEFENFLLGEMSPVNKRQMCIHWQAQIHASTSLIIRNSETSGSKIKENRSS
jgi:hypothetical protein